MSVHREENIENSLNFKKLINLLKYLNDNQTGKVLFSTHPRTMKKLEKNIQKKTSKHHISQTFFVC